MSGRPISASGPSIGNLVTDIFTIDKHPVTDIFTMKTTIVTMSVTGCVYREDVIQIQLLAFHIGHRIGTISCR